MYLIMKKNIYSKLIFLSLVGLLLISANAKVSHINAQTCDSDPALDIDGRLILCDNTIYTISDSFRLIGGTSTIECGTNTRIVDTDPRTPTILIPNEGLFSSGSIQRCVIETNGVGIQIDKRSDIGILIKNNTIRAFMGLKLIGSDYVNIDENIFETKYGIYAQEVQGRRPRAGLSRNTLKKPVSDPIGYIGVTLVGNSAFNISNNTWDVDAYRAGIYQYNGQATGAAILGGNIINGRSVGIYSNYNGGIYITKNPQFSQVGNTISGGHAIHVENTTTATIKDSIIESSNTGIYISNGNFADITDNNISGLAGVNIKEIKNSNIWSNSINSRFGILHEFSSLRLSGYGFSIANNIFTGDGNGIGVQSQKGTGGQIVDNTFTNYKTGIDITNGGIDSACINRQNDCDATYGDPGLTATGVLLQRNRINNEVLGNNGIGIQVADSRYIGIGGDNGQQSNIINVGSSCVKLKTTQNNLFTRVGIYSNNLTCRTTRPVEMTLPDCQDGVNCEITKQQDNEFANNCVYYEGSENFDPRTNPPVYINHRTKASRGYPASYGLFRWFVNGDGGLTFNGNFYDDISGDGNDRLWGWEDNPAFTWTSTTTYRELPLSQCPI